MVGCEVVLWRTVVAGRGVVRVVDRCGVVLPGDPWAKTTSMLKSAIAKDTIIGPMKAPVPISRFRVVRFASSSSCKASFNLGLFSSIRRDPNTLPPQKSDLKYEGRLSR